MFLALTLIYSVCFVESDIQQSTCGRSFVKGWPVAVHEAVRLA